MQGGREQQRLVHIRGSKALSHGRILSPNSLWKNCHVWCFAESIPDKFLEQIGIYCTRCKKGVPLAEAGSTLKRLRNAALKRRSTSARNDYSKSETDLIPANP